MIGVYFSGTGNTKYCISEFLKNYTDKDPNIYSIEDSETINKIKQNKEIIFAYPIYFSNLPKIVRDFIDNNKEIFINKKIFLIATMGLFSGDGTGCSARLFKKYGASVIGGLHLKMPDCISDVKLLKRTKNKNKKLIKKADFKIKKTVEKLKKGHSPREGLNIFCHLFGLFGQRLWFHKKTKNYTNELSLDKNKCIGCGLCANNCPTQNFKIIDRKPVVQGKCTMCYRCINNCPTQAITLLGKKVYEQCRFEDYRD